MQDEENTRQESIREKDRDIVYRNFHDKMQKEFLKTLVCDEVIEEYKNNPLGQHSEPLARLLYFFSSAPQEGKYALKRDQQSGTFKIIVLSGKRGEPPRIVENAEYKTLKEAYHGIFLRRIEGLMQS